MSVLYHPGKANVVADALSLLLMGNVAHIENNKIELVRDVHRLARLDVKAMQDLDLTLVELKEAVLKKSVEAFFQGRDGVLRYQGRLCVPNVYDVREQILSEAHSSRYSIHSGATRCTMTCRRSIGGFATPGFETRQNSYFSQICRCHPREATHIPWTEPQTVGRVGGWSPPAWTQTSEPQPDQQTVG
ncbi:hypothetical protein MTR67_039298 [Solanum verrucosum]|uniref:Uncharacterized protein n=1 Tax=Solanum verrucosum TaxID=315347 RepID=A0AAF0UI65_SOLVR|nr:hypothetical protein MTR67_039298 [Solanum verrucosum]